MKQSFLVLSIALTVSAVAQSGQLHRAANLQTALKSAGHMGTPAGQIANGGGQPALYADVRGYGAKGDGVTDDAPAIRRAVAAVEAAGGGTVYIPAGNYFFNSPDPYPTNPHYANKGFVMLNGNRIHVQCAAGAVLNASSAFSTGLFGFGLYGDGIHGMIDYKSGYQANPIPTLGAASITLSNSADASHFKSGDLIYILGGPGTESNGDGELNWVNSVDSSTGTLILLKPTSKPFTGNRSNIGVSGVVTVMNVSANYYYDNSVEGCTANLTHGDFTYFGTVLGIKLLNNTVHVPAGSARGMMLNSYFPLGQVEIAGNSYVMEHGGMLWQLADGFRDIFIHDNNFSAVMSGGMGGGGILNLSQGVVNLHIDHNNLSLIYPAENATGGNVAAILSGTAYQVEISDNQIFVSSQNKSHGPAAITLGLSNGHCVECIITGNFISDVDAANSVGGIVDYGASAIITNNRIVINGGRAGIATNTGSGPFYSESLISQNYIEMLNTADSAFGIIVGGPHEEQGYVSVVGNYIMGEGNARGVGIQFNSTINGDISHNYIANLPDGLRITGTPQLIGNECVHVAHAATTHCGSDSVLEDPGVSGLVTRTEPGKTRAANGSDVASAFTNHQMPGCYLTGVGSCVAPGGALSAGEVSGKINSAPQATSSAAVPAWLQYLGDGSEGAATLNGFLSGEHWYSSVTLTGSVCANGPLIIRSTGECAISGAIHASANSCINAGNIYAGNFGAGGGGGGYGRANGAVGPGSGEGGVGGAAGKESAPGGAGNAATMQQQHSLIAYSPRMNINIQSGTITYGGSPGGLGQGNSGQSRGGGFVVLDCQSLRFTGTIDVSGVNGAAGGNNIGGNGGGGGGIVILRSPNLLNTGSINVTGGNGGEAGVGSSTAGGAGGMGWSTAIAY